MSALNILEKGLDEYRDNYQKFLKHIACSMANIPPEEGQAAAELSEDAGTEEGYAPALE